MSWLSNLLGRSTAEGKRTPEARPESEPEKDTDLWGAAVSAACADDLDVLKSLIARGLDVRGADAGGQTLLHYAARHGRERTARFLLESGAAVDASDRTGTPLSVASGEGKLAMMKLLIDAGADVDHRNGLSGATPLHFACGLPSPDAARILLDGGAKVDSVDDQGNTPLFEACKRNLETVKLLVGQGADIQRENRDGKTALRYAEANERENIVRYLRGLGIRQRVKVAVLVFLFEVHEPPRGDAESVCLPILREHCPEEELGRSFVVGRKDRFDAELAMGMYCEYVSNRQIPDLGENFKTVELPSGSGLALFFRIA